MRRMPIALAMFATMASAQERPTPPDRRDLAPTRDSVVAVLPTIDLPEYVITGVSSIELPRVEKRLDDGDRTGNVVVAPASPVRDRVEGPAPGAELEGRPAVEATAGFQGHLRAGIGSFRTPQISASLRSAWEAIALGASGFYRRSSGFAPETGWSEGGADGSAAIPLDLGSAGFRNATLSGDLGFESRSYRWYGSPSPADRRTISIVEGGVAARGWLGGWNGGLLLRFGSTSIDDTSSSVSEARTRVAAGAEGEIAGIPITASLSVVSSNRSLSTASPAGVTSMKVEGRWQPMESVWLAAGFGVAYLQGDGGQKRGLLLPAVRVQFTIDEHHRLVGAFEPRPEGITLMSSQSRHRFLDARTPLRQTAWTNAGRFGLESDWTANVRTRVEVEAGTARDLAMVTDTAGRGVAQWLYGDASFAAVRAECVAKMHGNDYFSATMIIRSSRNAGSGEAVPYWPGFEAVASYTAYVMPQVSVRGAVQVVGARESQWSGPSATLPAYAVIDLSGTYLILPSLSVWMEASNLLNTVYQHWKGIQEPPFRLSAGIALAW